MKILQVCIRTKEPVRIADDATSQNGQARTLRYIPGSTLRGLIVSSLAKEEDFEKIKKDLFGKVKYLNAYPSVPDGSGREVLLPSPKGFYEDKAQSRLENVVLEGKFEEGMKRAKIGQFSRFVDGTLEYYSVDVGSDLKILSNVKNQKDRNVFRNEYIKTGTEFTGCIFLEEEGLAERFQKLLTGERLLGNARSAGYGKCELSCEITDRLPYSEYEPDEPCHGECYMYLLSNTVMRDEMGELCGLDLHALGKKMGVERLAISHCATATTDVKGYNRTWGCKIPSAVMYEAGSVFHLTFDGDLSKEAMCRLRCEGIGIRVNEGFGQVLFLKDYEKIHAKKAGNLYAVINGTKQASAPLTGEEVTTLHIIARSYYRQQIEEAMQRYILEKPLAKGTESRSRLGQLEAYTTALQYDPEKAMKQIREYYDHAEEKENAQSVQQERASMKQIKKHVLYVLDHRLEEILDIATKEKDTVMGIPKEKLLTKDEEDRLKLSFLSKEIRFDHKGVN